MGFELDSSRTAGADPDTVDKLSGFLDAFEGISLWYPTGIQNAVWQIESSAGNHALSISPPFMALTEYGVFLGAVFGNTVAAAAYSYQESALSDS